jgi:benzylsuccinate CoA-transferase BbsF subunit
MAGAFLADLGADVVKVEHGKRLDNMRLRGRMPSAIPEAHRDVDKRETDPLFHNVNRGKRSLLMDMKSDRGRELFLDLVERSDVVLESFRPHVLDSWGLGYDELKARNPKLVLVSLRGLELGDYGGESGLRSYAPVTSSLVGMESAIAYPDGDGPVGAMALGVSDPIAGWHGVGLALAALLQARRTGLGGWVKLSQLETLASTLTDMYLAEQMGGDGSDDPQPHSEGVRCADGDVLVTLHDAGWAVLTGGSEGVSSATLTGAPGRWETAADRATLEQSVGDLGGGCWPVRGVSEHSDWPARHGRRLLTEVRHDLTGREELYGHGWTLDGHQVLPTASAPVIGKHTDDVLRQYLDLDVATIEELRRSGVLS